MKKRILSLLLAFLTVVSICPTPTYAADDVSVYDGTADVGKYAELSYFSAEYGVSVSADPVSDPDGLVFYLKEFGENTVMQISDWYWDADTTALWYRVELYSGAFPESTDTYSWPETPWIFQIYTENWAETDLALTFIDPPVPDEPETGCPVCGQPGCEMVHRVCQVCGQENCTETHLYCSICDSYACTEIHRYCSVCGQLECGQTHEDSTPDVAPIIPEAPVLTEDVEVSVVDANGEPVDGGLYLMEGTKSSISAWTDLTGEVSYRWQICYDIENDLWADIQGQTGKGMLTSPAMFESIRQELGEVYIRSIATNEEETRTGEAIPVEIGSGLSLFAARAADDTQVTLSVSFVNDGGDVVAEGQTWPVTSGAAVDQSVVLPAVSGYLPSVNNPYCRMENGNLIVSIPEGVLTEDTHVTVTYKQTDKIYVIVSYKYSDGRTAAATDFAEIVPGQAYSHSYALPDVPGYEASLNVHSFGSSVCIKDGELKVDLAANALTSDTTTFFVTYSPTYVEYTILHYLQNVENDDYALSEKETRNDKKTGQVIDNIAKEYEGFYSLHHDTPAAAADGSTVVEIYYDRYYYLMKFDLGDMGYGVDPIYARYGAPIEVGTPVRAGYAFKGWDLVDPVTGEGDGVADTIPAAMPHEGQQYKAIWEANPTAKVSVVIWGENADDEEYSYQKTLVAEVKPGTVISWDSIQKGTLYSCGEASHTHGAACSTVCGKEAHAHSASCYSCGSEVHTHSLVCYTVSGGSLAGNPEDVNPEHYDKDIYSTGYGWTATYYLKIGNEYYRINLNRWTNINDFEYSRTCGKSEHTHGTACNVSCGLAVHAHGESCYSCGMAEHVHGNACQYNGKVMDSDLWELAEYDKDVEVKADGSTVMNVYYDRTEKTLTFHYNYRNKKYNNTETITAKWGAHIATQYVAIVDKAGSTFWSKDQDGDGPYTNYFGIMPKANATYYYKDAGGKSGTMTYYGETLTGGYEEMFSVGNVGGYTVTAEDRYEFEGFTYSHGTANGKNCDGAAFYYNRNRYTLVFNDGYNDVITESVLYEAPLGGYDSLEYRPSLPAAYEAGSRVFAGWYLNPQCTGTQYDLSEHTMPAENLILYAKWEPVEYEVKYFMSRESLGRGETIPVEMERLVQDALAAGIITQSPAEDPYSVAFQKEIVKHGSYIPNAKGKNPGVSEGYEGIHPKEGIDFIGWFYLNDDGEEVAFDPENLPVTDNLNLFAKWQSKTICQYNVYFALDNNGDGVADVDADGNVIYIAAPISGSGMAETTYTIGAKGGDDLYEAYRTGYFPVVDSHSITLDINDVGGIDENTFIFLYKKRDAVPYTVRYLEKGTNAVLHPEKYVAGNEKVVVTETYEPINKYLSDAYQKTLVVTADGTNVITFWYTKDEQHAMYAVNYYIQELNEDMSHKGWSKYTDLQNTGVIDQDYSAKAITIDGFTLSKDYTDQFNGAGKNDYTGSNLPASVGNLDNGSISGKLTENGLELNFYYTRNLYPYEFRYALKDTATMLEKPTVGMAGFSMTVTEAAKEIIMDLDGDGIDEEYRLYDADENNKSNQIKKDGDPLSLADTVVAGNAKLNVDTFFYVRCTRSLSVTKKVEGTENPDPDEEFSFILQIHAKSGYHKSSYDYVLSTGETGAITAEMNMEMSAADLLRFTLKAGETITFDGLPTAEYTITEVDIPQDYYIDEESRTFTLTTDPNDVDALIFVNQYKEKLGTLTISKTLLTPTVTPNSSDSKDFLFHVTGNGVDMDVIVPGNGSVTIYNLPLGEYTVTEDTDWNWRYVIKGNAAQTETLTVGEPDKTVSFENTYKENKWLNFFVNRLNEFPKSN